MASQGTWSGTAPLSYAYRWQSASAAAGPFSDIAGATASTYTPVAADVGAYLRVAVTATNSAGQATTPSAAVGPVGTAASPPVSSVAPSVAGSAVVGQVLTASQGTWSGTAPLSYAYRWQSAAAAAGPFSDI